MRRVLFEILTLCALAVCAMLIAPGQETTELPPAITRDSCLMCGEPTCSCESDPDPCVSPSQRRYLAELARKEGRP